MFRAAAFLAALLFIGLPAFAQDTKDQSQIPPAAGSEQPPAAGDQQDQQGEDLTSPDGNSDVQGDDSEVSPDEMSLGEIPSIQTVELTPDMARRAVDVFALVREKYKDSNLEEYENLQDFVDQTPDGKNFEADVKAHGFNTVTDWNTAITTVGFAYSALTDNQTDDVKAQIEEVKKDTSIAQDLKDKMIASLTAMIPSENNLRVVRDLMNEPAYSDKLKLLAEEE
jgi:hypothetical protein